MQKDKGLQIAVSTFAAGEWGDQEHSPVGAIASLDCLVPAGTLPRPRIKAIAPDRPIPAVTIEKLKERTSNVKKRSWQIVAGLKVPSKLIFGDDRHILLRKRIEHRLTLIEEGITCPWCKSKMMLVSEDYEHNILEWQCACGENFETDCDGDDEDWSDYSD